tara:strand:- start:1079 stop:1243 length:165 start_codon:yes stop_codon:yes gene_type:complete
MNITSAKYKVFLDNKNIKATIDGVETIVPINEGNRHYAAILEWVSAGNTIEEAD